MVKRLAMICLLPMISAPAWAGRTQDAPAPTRAGDLGLYQGANYSGPEYLVDEERSFVQAGGIVRSVSVHPGERWLICGQPGFRGPCMVLDRSVPDAGMLGEIRRIRSARPLPGGN